MTISSAPTHINWFVNTGQQLKTVDGKNIDVWEFHHKNDAAILSAWAKHFRNHYCLDNQIDIMRGKLSRSDYLTKFKFPSETSPIGRAIRAGDFGEILLSDYIQWHLNFWVPRIRFLSKVIKDESPKGSDVIGFQFYEKNGCTSTKDVLLVFESKTKFSASTINRLQTAINDSAKDHIRIDESLNFIKQKFMDKNELDKVKLVERFQNPVDIPYEETYGAALIISDEYFDTNELATANCMKTPKREKREELVPHPKRDNLILLIIKGHNMMNLVHELYRRASNEA